MHRPLLLALTLAGCQPAIDGPPPRIDMVEPNFLCHEQPSTLTVRGDGFTPVVTDALSHTAALDVGSLVLDMESDLFGRTASGRTLPVSQDDVLWISEIEFEVALDPELDWLDGLYGITLTNVDGQSADRAQAVVAAPAPTLAEVSPVLVCLAQDDVEVTVLGGSFLVLPDADPSVTIGGWTAPREVASECTVVMGPVAGDSCAALTVTVPQGLLGSGIFSVSVANPDPADCATSEAKDIVVVAAPSLAGIAPSRLCSEAGDTQLTITGGDFLVVDGVPPTVTIDHDVVSVAQADECNPVKGLESVESCNKLVVDASVGGLAGGDHLVSVTNPVPADCASSTLTLTIDRLPVVSDIDPDHVCETGGTFTISGKDFSEDAIVSVDDVEVAAEFVDSGTLDITVPSGFKPGKHVVTIVQGRCQTTLKTTLEVLVPPVLLAVQPAVVQTTEDVDITLSISGITGELTGVWLVSVVDATVTDLTFDWDDDTPDIATAVVPAGLAEGFYDVYIELDDNCPGFLASGLEVAP